ncbi:MAG: sensor histidine kinase [Gaiellaceae bacterium]
MTDNFPEPSRREVITLELSHVETSKESLDRLRDEVAELRASRERLAVAADGDRRGIERELHDGLQQRLVALAVNLQLARDLLEDDPTAARELLDEMGGDVQGALDATASLAQRIYPPLLAAGGLGAALRAAAVSTGVQARIDVTGLTACPREVAGTVYFCCLEVLELVGEGARVAIEVRAADGALVLEVTADRSGSEGSRREDGLERSIDRVGALGGRLTVESEPGPGIRVTGSLPLAR